MNTNEMNKLLSHVLYTVLRCKYYLYADDLKIYLHFKLGDSKRAVEQMKDDISGGGNIV